MKVGSARVLASAFWRTLETAGTEAISFLFFVVLTRLLVPEQFGAVALAGAVVQVLQTLVYQGLPDALIQRQSLDDREYRAAASAVLAIGLGLTLLAVTFAWPLGAVLHRSEFPLILCALAPTILAQSISAPIHAMQRRSMNYRLIAIRTLLGTAIGGALAIALARGGWGVWALVIQQWTVALTGMIVLMAASGRRPWPWRWDPTALEPLMRIARPIMLGQLASTAARRLDVVVLGLFLSDHDVGTYFLIARLLWAVQMVTQNSMSELTLVVLSKMQADADAHREGVRRAVRFTVFICLLCFGGLVVLSGELIPLVFGLAWTDAIEPLRWIALLSAAGALVSTSAGALLSSGDAQASARLTVGAALFQLAVIFLAARFGLSTLTLAIGLAQLVTVAPALWCLSRRFGVAPMTWFGDLVPIAAGFVIVFALFTLPFQTGSLTLTVAAGLGFGVSMCAWGFWLFREEAVVRRMLRR